MKVKELIVKLQNLDTDLQELDIVIQPNLHWLDVENKPFRAQDVLNNKIPNITIGMQHAKCYSDTYFIFEEEDFEKPLDYKKVVVLSAPTFHFGIEEGDSL